MTSGRPMGNTRNHFWVFSLGKCAVSRPYMEIVLTQLPLYDIPRQRRFRSFIILLFVELFQIETHNSDLLFAFWSNLLWGYWGNGYLKRKCRIWFTFKCTRYLLYSFSIIAMVICDWCSIVLSANKENKKIIWIMRILYRVKPVLAKLVIS